MDLREVPRRMGYVARIALQSRVANLRAIPFSLGESLPVFQEMRLKKQLRLKGARIGGQDVTAVQEDWEGGFTVFLPTPLQAGESVTIEVTADGEFIQGSDVIAECHYPLSNTDWLPRHGYLDRATFDLTFRHLRRHKIASIGVRTSERNDETARDAMITTYKMDQPVAFAVFAVGPFTRQTQSVVWEAGGTPTPLEFNALPRAAFQMNTDFLLEELNNSVRYFAAMFGAVSVPDLRRGVSPVPVRAGLSDAADAAAGGSIQRRDVRLHRPRNRPPVVGQHRRVAVVPRPVAERGIRGVLGHALRRAARQDQPEHAARADPAARGRRCAIRRGRRPASARSGSWTSGRSSSAIA